MDLRVAGWEQAERGRVVTWQTPDRDFYRSKEVTVEMDWGRTKPHVPRCRGGGT